MPKKVSKLYADFFGLTIYAQERDPRFFLKQVNCYNFFQVVQNLISSIFVFLIYPYQYSKLKPGRQS